MTEEQYIGNYRVLDLVGRGGMGKVFLAVHEDVPNLRVILKILSDPRLGDRFKQEADKLALLDGHPNICQIKHFFHHDDDLVIAMEYIDGTDLGERIKTEGRLSITEATRIVTDMLAILSYAHERGISHRDIKPSNVMIDKAGQVKIIDFGIAKGKTDPNLTMTGASLGTPAYMAPEQFIPADDTDYALADIYACGITLYQMLTGQLPFKGDNEFVLRDAKLNEKPASARSLNPGISKELDKIILKAIDKDPAKRFQSGEDMRKALRAAATDQADRADQPTQQVGATRVEQGPVIPGKPRKSKRNLYLVGSVALVILAVLLLWLTGGPPQTASRPESPTLIAPDNNTVFSNDKPVVLRWEPTVTENGRYRVEIARDTTIDKASSFRWSADTFTIDADATPGRYRWRVTTETDEGVAGEPSVIRTFEIRSATVPEGRLAVTVEPSGDVYIGDRIQERNSTGFNIAIDTGSYLIRAENSRSREKILTKRIRVAPGETVNHSFTFTIPPRPPVAEPAEVRVGSSPRGADIFVNGTKQDVQTNNTLRLKPGKYTITVEITRDGQNLSRSRDITVAGDTVHKVLFDFDR